LRYKVISLIFLFILVFAGCNIGESKETISQVLISTLSPKPEIQKTSTPRLADTPPKSGKSLSNIPTNTVSIDPTVTPTTLFDRIINEQHQWDETRVVESTQIVEFNNPCDTSQYAYDISPDKNWIYCGGAKEINLKEKLG
jgi:hypothetical protein